jgi:hypothetical protein
MPGADAILMQQKDILLAWKKRAGSVAQALAAAANEMMNLCRGLGLGRYDFVIVPRSLPTPAASRLDTLRAPMR